MKNKFPLIVAVILALVAVLGINSYVKSVKQAEASKFKGEYVVAASQNIAEGATLTESMLYQKSVPGQFIPPQAVRGQDELRQLLDRKTRVNIKAGDLLLWSDVEIEQWGGLSTLIPVGERAFTVGINNGVPSSLLQANDRVDILGLFVLPKDGGGAAGSTAAWRESSDIVCVVLLQDVAILAVGEELRNVGRAGSSGGGDLTFAVTLPEAQLLMFSEQHGELGVALRGEGEVQVLDRKDLVQVTYQELEKVIGELDGERKKRVVKIQRGRETDQVDVDAAEEAP